MVAFVAPQGALATLPSAHGTLIVARFVQPENAVESIEVGVLWNVMLVSEVQL